MAMLTIEELFDHELQDIYAAERLQLDVLERMAHEGADREIRRLYAQHRRETQAQMRRLEKIFRLRGRKAETRATSPALEGLIAQRKAVLREKPSEDLLEFYTIGAAQRIERYEISAYETLLDMAEKLGLDAAVDLLEENLQEEEVALHRLKVVASEFEVAVAIDEEAAAVRR